MLAITVACSDGDSAVATPTPEATATTLVVPSTRGTPALTTTATPEAAALETSERVWVYADSTIVPETCFDLVADMIPADAPTSIAGKAVECNVGAADHVRATYQRGPDGVLHLAEVELFVLTAPSLPQPYTYSSCRDIAAYLLPASVPSEQAGFLAICSWSPTPRGSAMQPRIETWSGVPVGSSRTDFPADTPCWVMLGYLGSQLEAQTVKVRCVID
jgi:hypothetical protein